MDVLGLLNIIATLAAVFFGFWLSEQSTRRREREAEQKQVEAVQALIRLEIEQNLKLLRQMQRYITSRVQGVIYKGAMYTVQSYPHKLKEEMVSDLIDLPVLNISTKILDS